MLGQCYCQEIVLEDWQEKEQLWPEPRYFYLATIMMALHSPLTYNEDISRAMIEAKGKGYLIKPRPLILLKSGLFRGEIYIEIQPPQDKREDKSLRMISGRFYSIVTGTPLFQMGKVVDKLLRDLKKKKEKVRDIYLCLVTCPQCAHSKGGQTIVLAHLK